PTSSHFPYTTLFRSSIADKVEQSSSAQLAGSGLEISRDAVMTSVAPVVETTIADLKLVRRGKVRDVYEVDDARLLIVATDRISRSEEHTSELQSRFD